MTVPAFSYAVVAAKCSDLLANDLFHGLFGIFKEDNRPGGDVFQIVRLCLNAPVHGRYHIVVNIDLGNAMPDDGLPLLNSHPPYAIIF